MVFMFGPLLLGLSLAAISQMLDVLSHHLTKENIHTDVFVLISCLYRNFVILCFCSFRKCWPTKEAGVLESSLEQH